MADTTIGLSACVPLEVLTKALNNAFALDINVSTPKDAKEEADILASGGMLLRYRVITGSSGLDDLTMKVGVDNSTRRRSSSRATGSLAAPPFPFGLKAEEKPSSGNGNEGKDDGSNPAMSALRSENETLRRKLAELDANHKQSLATIKTFHQSQQQLFNDFVLLREKYDEAKSRMGDILWSYLPANTNYCPSVPPTNPALLESDKRVAEYDIGDKLGEGQFAIVYKCMKRRGTPGGERKGDDEELALKIINKERVSSLAALKRVDNEVMAQTTLRHRGILHIHDIFNGRRGLYLIMEKGGKDLFDYSDENPERLGESDCKRIARSIIDAIHHCHSMGICHRDLKPENILLNTVSKASFGRQNDSIFDVKVCDFGLSATFIRGKKLTDFCGSPGFFAPEMITLCSSTGYDGPAVDVWSIGCIILELTVGHEVFCDQWMPAYNYELLQDPPKFEGRLLDCLCALEFWMRSELHLSAHRVDFILGLLTVDPNKRLTMEEVVSHPWVRMEDGGTFLTGLQTHKSVTPPYRSRSRSPPRSSCNTPLGNSNNSASGKPRGRPAPLKVERVDEQEHDLDTARTAADVQLQQAFVTEPQPLQQNRVAFSGAAMGSAGLDDSCDGDDDLDESRRPDRTSYGEDQALVNGGVPWRSAISQKVRSKMEQKTTKEADKAGNKGVQLPPLEPMTPAVHGAKKLMNHGNELLLKATEDAQHAEDNDVLNNNQLAGTGGGYFR